MAFNLDEIDQHMANLRSTLQFFSQALERTDHNSPDWLATDLVALRNQSGRLQDGMQKFREHLVSEGLAEKKTPNPRGRLSLEGSRRPTPSSTPLHPSAKPSNSAQTTPVQSHPQQHASPSPEQYPIQRIDVTEEVNRRLRESRLRRLMDQPSTSQKRKFDNSEGAESGRDAEVGDEQEDVWMGRSPIKRIRASGTFEPIGNVMKRKEGGMTVGWQDVGKDDRGDNKRRKR